MRYSQLWRGDTLITCAACDQRKNRFVECQSRNPAIKALWSEKLLKVSSQPIQAGLDFGSIMAYY